MGLNSWMECGDSAGLGLCGVAGARGWGGWGGLRWVDVLWVGGWGERFPHSAMTS